ncbi:MAG: winged helix-turn-helix domain-containing protein [Reyranella sp.]|nr:winged helix-turn-helix domain-containing protein [Reyranella sp.]
MPASVQNLVFTCGPWEVDLGRRELRSNGAPVALGNRAFEIVEVLAGAAGQLVTKDDLMERIWPGAIVGDNTLHVHIAAVRKALGSDRAMLQTAPGRGYRLVGGWIGQRGEAAEAPSPSPRRMPPAERPATNFPVVVTRLVGRSTAVQRVRDLVSAYRVVTLTGPGGIGKTALALKAVRDLLPDFEDGAWLVELASLSDAALAPSAVAAALGLKLGSDQVTAETLAHAIGDRHLLLLLDNCEHLIDAVAALTEAVMSLCPRVTVLATSREIMRIQGESVYRVPALDVPAAGEEAPNIILDHSAVELFVARVKALDAGFAAQPADLSSIVEVCRHLDGIPLAIEFAAARAALVGTEQVASGLRDRFALLTSGRRTTIPRHRTLRAVLDWSYGLLSPEEQRLLRHLAMFPAGFTFEAAEAVGSLDTHSVVDELSSLVSKSLCERINSTSLTRWRLLETIRAYALEKLAENGEYAAAARRHAAYFRDLISQVTANSTVWLSREDVARCGSELDNVRAALDWAFGPDGDPDIGVGLTIAFAPIWQTLSLMGECRARVERMLATGPPDSRLNQTTALRMWLAYGEALTMTFASVERTRDACQKVMDLAAGLDDVELQAGLHYLQWSLDFMAGDQSAALIWAQRLAAMAPSGDIMRLTADRILGASLLSAGKLGDAEDCLQRVVDFHGTPSGGQHSPLFRRDPHVLARVRLARVLGLRGHLDRAYAEARTSFEMAQASGAAITVCWAIHDALSPIALAMGDLDAAESATATMSTWATRIDAALWKVMASCWKGRLLVERGEIAQGTELISQALAACEQTGWQMGYVQFLGWIADGLTRLGHLEEAGGKLEHALLWAHSNGEAWYRPELMRMKGEVLVRQSRTTEAEDCLRTAAEITREQGALFCELRVAISLARLRIGQGRQDEVPPLVAPVYGRFTEGFDTPDLRAARVLLGI